MPDEATRAAIRAAVEVIVPAVDGIPGAADLGVDRHVEHAVETYLPGFADLLVALLDATAAEVRPGAAFVDLDVDERGRVLLAMSSDDSQDVRDVADALFIFTLGGTYSEWPGYDAQRGHLDPPPSWARLGFHGPSRGFPDYRRPT